MIELLIALLGAVMVSVVVYLVLRAGQRPQGPQPTEAAAVAQAEVQVTLPVDDADPDAPATRRLVADAAHRILASDAQISTVIVLSRGGRELGRVHRRAPVAPRPFIDVPLALREHPPRHHAPHVPIDPRDASGAHAEVRFAEEPARPHRPLADHFDLPPGVRVRILNAEDPVEIVTAILEEAGASFQADGHLIRLSDGVLIVLRTPIHVAVPAEGLNAAYLEFQRSGARRGVVVTAGNVSMHDVQRRETLAPALRHAGPEGIQRMADAVAMRADPLEFVVHTW